LAGYVGKTEYYNTLSRNLTGNLVSTTHNDDTITMIVSIDYSSYVRTVVFQTDEILFVSISWLCEFIDRYISVVVFWFVSTTRKFTRKQNSHLSELKSLLLPCCFLKLSFLILTFI